MKKILLDTNFLTAPFQLSIALFEEIDRLYPYNQVYTIDDAVNEAKSIENGKFKDLVPQLIEKSVIEVLETEGEGEVDDLLVGLCDEFVIATNDKELKNRILSRDRPVILIRSGTHLEVANARSEDFR